MQNSSSHKINGDYPLSALSKIKWLVFNARDNLKRVRGGINIRKFPLEVNHETLSMLNKSDSPSRNLCNLFWSQLRFHELVGIEKDKTFNLLEVGCGSGRYQKILESYGNVFNYKGIDPVYSDNWEKVSSESSIQFFCDTSDNVNLYLTDIDVVITQSSLEHIESDLSFFHKLKNFTEVSGKTLVSINLVPSPANLLLAPWHGIRQYGAHTINDLIEIVGEKTESRIYLLGGRSSTGLQFKELTLKSIFGKPSGTKSEGYIIKMFEALKRDSRNSQKINIFNATFIAFIFIFNPREELSLA